MTLLGVTAVIVVIGGMGGILNALITDNGFFRPDTAQVDGRQIWRPGVLGNILFGAAASFVTFGLNGPFAQAGLIGAAQAAGSPSEAFTLATLVGGFLSGVGGARVITSEIDKRLLSAAATTAATALPNSAAAAQMTRTTPARALDIARHMERPSDQGVVA